MSADAYHVADEVQTRSFEWALMRRLLAMLRPYRRSLVASLLLLIAASCLSNASPLLMMYAVDHYINVPADQAQDLDATVSGLYSITLMIAGIVLLETIIRCAQLLIVTWIGQRTMFEMRMDLFRHIQQLPLSFLDRNPVGRLMSRVTSDVDKI
ncbi:MAG: hypothetical protein RLZZ303_711, partial [Candidatus Hydrogenedentota bacterium]